MAEWKTAGKVRMTPKGEHDSTVPYNILDVVRNSTGDITYVAKQNVPAGTALSNTDYWEVIVSADGAVKYDTAQSLTAVQQTQARENIDASATGDVEALQELVKTLCPAVTVGPAAVASVSDAVALAPDSLTVAVTPVQAGTGDPSPDNIRPITGRTGANVYHAGKNLLGGFASGTGTGNGLTFVYNGGTHITISGVQTGSNADSPNKWLMDEALSNTRSLYVPAGTTLTIELKNTGLTSTPGILILFSTEEGITVNSAETTNLKWTVTPSVDVHLIRMRFRGKTVNADYGTISGDVMLYFGDGDTEYTAPVAQTAIAVSWQTEAGTIYGGTLDMLTGALTVTHVATTVGSYSWRHLDTWADYVWGTSIQIPNIYGDRGSVYSDTFATYGSAGIDENAPTGVINKNNSPTNGYIYVKDTAYTTPEEFAQGRADAVIVYQLATPNVYQLTPAQITMLTGSNTLWADCGDTTLTYCANPYDKLLALIRSYHPDTTVQSVSPLMMSMPNAATNYIEDEISTEDEEE